MRRAGVTVTVTNLSQASLGRPSPRALKPRLRYKLNHGVVGEVYYNLYTRGARPGRVVCLRCSCEYVGDRTHCTVTSFLQWYEGLPS